MSGREQDAVASTRIDYTDLDPLYGTTIAFRGSLYSYISDSPRLRSGSLGQGAQGTCVALPVTPFCENARHDDIQAFAFHVRT